MTSVAQGEGGGRPAVAEEVEDVHEGDVAVGAGGEDGVAVEKIVVQADRQWPLDFSE